MSLHHHKTKRVSIDLPFEKHIYMKIACAKEDISIKRFIEESIDKSLKALEEKLDAEAYDQGKKEIKAHGTISIEEMDKRLGFNVQD